MAVNRAESRDESDREPRREKTSKERQGDERRKPFEPPALTRHESLPEVTSGFAGTFNP